MKNWKNISLVVLFLALCITIFYLVKQIRINEQVIDKIELLESVLKKNNEVFARNYELLRELHISKEKNNYIIIADESLYKKIKSSPNKRNYTDAELTQWLKSYESNHNKK